MAQTTGGGRHKKGGQSFWHDNEQNLCGITIIKWGIEGLRIAEHILYNALQKLGVVDRKNTHISPVFEEPN